MELSQPSRTRLRRRADADQPAVRADRRAARHADRRAARHRPGRDDRDAAADDLRAAAGVRADHARRHLLRRAIRRLDDVDPRQHARRVVVGRSPASTATRWRARARPAPRSPIAALGSFFAGTVRDGAASPPFATPLSELALKFGPAEYFSLMVLGLIGAVVLAHGSLLKAIAMIVLGLLLGIVGTDVNSGVARFAFGIPGADRRHRRRRRRDGPVRLCRDHHQPRDRRKSASWSRARSRACGSRRRSSRLAWPAVLRGTALGSVLGVLPGGGAMLSSFASYSAREEGRQGSVAVRQGRDPGRRRARVGQQRRRADVVHSAADARHPRERRDGADGRRDDDPQHPARAAGDDVATRSCSGD